MKEGLGIWTVHLMPTTSTGSEPQTQHNTTGQPVIGSQGPWDLLTVTEMIWSVEAKQELMARGLGSHPWVLVLEM